MEEPPAAGAPLEGWYIAAPDRAEGAAIGQWSSAEAPTGGCLRLGDRGSLVFWKMYVGLGLLGLSELILFGGVFMGMVSPKPAAPASRPPAA